MIVLLFSSLIGVLFLNGLVGAALWIIAKTKAYSTKGIDSNAEEVLVMRLWGTRISSSLRQDKREVAYGNFFLSSPVWGLYLWTRINSQFAWQQYIIEWLLLNMDKFFGGVISFILWRVKTFETFLREELEVGCKQIVMLGAGWDTRAYRYAKERHCAGAVVYEIDIRALQMAKCAALYELAESGRVDCSQLEQVRYVSCDLNTDDLTEALKKHGFQSDLRTLVLWEGVTWYLSEDAVRKTLRSLKKLVDTKTALKLMFDYCPAKQLSKTTQSSGFRRLQAMSERKGIKFTYGMEPEKVKAFLNSENYEMVEEWDSKRAASLYMPPGFQKDYDFGRIVLCELSS